MHHRILLIALLVGRAAPVTAAAPEVKPGKYYRDRDTGTLLVERGRSGELTFEIESVGANCHSCSLAGPLRGTSGLADEGNGLTCRVGFKTVGRTVAVQALSDTCRSFCGVRAYFDGSYHALPKACTSAARQARRDEFTVLYQASRYPAAVSSLNSLIDQCKAYMNWIEVDEVRNDLALSQYNSGRPDECLATLKATLAHGFDGEESLRGDGGRTMYLLNCDFDNYIPVAKITWSTRALCEEAAQRSR